MVVARLKGVTIMSDEEIRYIERLIRIARMSVNNNCTCSLCEENETCEYAFDKFNTDGDCLAEK